jgi:hypothetical protein
MIPPICLGIENNHMVLDMCAAPVIPFYIRAGKQFK